MDTFIPTFLFLTEKVVVNNRKKYSFKTDSNRNLLLFTEGVLPITLYTRKWWIRSNSLLHINNLIFYDRSQDRTGDLFHVTEMLSQLSYPTKISNRIYQPELARYLAVQKESSISFQLHLCI